MFQPGGAWICCHWLFLSHLCVNSACVGPEAGGWVHLSTIRRVFSLYSGPAPSVRLFQALCHITGRAVWTCLPRGRCSLVLIRITSICLESCFCWNSECQVLAAGVWANLLEIERSSLTQRRDTPQPSVTGYRNMTAVREQSFNTPPI